MQRQGHTTPMSGMDSFFFSIESDVCPMNLGLLITVTGPDQASCEKSLREAIDRNVQGALRFNQRITLQTRGLRQPAWQHVPGLDPQSRIQRHELPAGAGDNELHALINKLMMTRMPRDNVLWEVHIIAGPQSDRITALFKLHHACADGMGSLKLFSKALTGAGGAPWVSDPVDTGNHGLGQWLARAGTNIISLLSYPFMWLGVNAYLWRLSCNTQGQTHEPDSLFASAVGPGRSYAMITLPRARAQQVNRCYGSSENELLMSIYAGALRRYLGERKLLPAHSIHVGMTYSIMFSESRKNMSNQASFSQLSLATRIGDPVRRLQQMKKRCARALERQPSPTWRHLQTIMQYASHRLMALTANRFVQLLRAGKIMSRFSAFATYMPGPVRRIELGGCAIESIYPLGIIYHGAGLSLSAMRYAKNIHCGVVADEKHMPDPHAFAALLEDEFETLHQHATRQTSSN